MNEIRYSRQTLFPQIGPEGQEQLKERAVIIIGCGALGTVTANYLTRAGIGRIKIVDRDFVELDNLQRQVFFDEADVRQRLPKAVAAVEKLKQVNSSIQLEAEVCDVNARNIEKLIKGFDLVLDALDNMETRFLINDACIKNNIPWIYGAAVSSYGMTMNIIPGKTACFRCLIEEIPSPGSMPTCDTVGILNTVPGIIASLQSTEAIKILVGSSDINTGLTYIDVWQQTFRQMNLKPRADCMACGKKDFEFLKREKVSWTTSLCGRNAVQIYPPEEKQISLERLKQNLEPLGEVFYNGFLLNFKTGDYELIIFPTGRTMVKGTTDESIARSLYAKYVGT